MLVESIGDIRQQMGENAWETKLPSFVLIGIIRSSGMDSGWLLCKPHYPCQLHGEWVDDVTLLYSLFVVL